MERRTRKRKRSKDSFSVERSDRLFQIFEKHLYDFNYETRENFLTTVVREYMLDFQKSGVAVPAARRALLESTLMEEVADMLVRKIYGCLTVKDPHGSMESEARDEAGLPSELVKRGEAIKKRADKMGKGGLANVNFEAAAAAMGLTPEELKKKLDRSNR